MRKLNTVNYNKLSTLKSYGLSRNVSHKTTSGAIQYGVPINVSCFCNVNLFFADTPKSAAKEKRKNILQSNFMYNGKSVSKGNFSAFC